MEQYFVTVTILYAFLTKLSIYYCLVSVILVMNHKSKDLKTVWIFIKVLDNMPYYFLKTQLHIILIQKQHSNKKWIY